MTPVSRSIKGLGKPSNNPVTKAFANAATTGLTFTVSKPKNPTTGDSFFDTKTGALFMWDGNNWAPMTDSAAEFGGFPTPICKAIDRIEDKVAETYSVGGNVWSLSDNELEEKYPDLKELRDKYNQKKKEQLQDLIDEYEELTKKYLTFEILAADRENEA